MLEASYSSLFVPAYDSYGTLQLTNTQAPFAEPLTLAQMKQYLRVETNDDDALISTLITAARSQAELVQRRILVPKQYDLTFDFWPAYRIELLPLVTSVDLVQYMDSDGAKHTLAAGTDYIADFSKDPAILTTPLDKCWPSFTPQPSSSILIRFTCGYSPTDPFWNGLGARLKAGMMLLVSAWYNNRLPFVTGTVTEYPYAVTACLNGGNNRRPR